MELVGWPCTKIEVYGGLLSISLQGAVEKGQGLIILSPPKLCHVAIIYSIIYYLSFYPLSILLSIIRSIIY